MPSLKQPILAASETVATGAEEEVGRLDKRADIEALLAARKVCVLAARMHSKASAEREDGDICGDQPH